jgi:hypothetical protein
MIDLGKITFTSSYEDGHSVTHTIRGDSSLDEVVEAFEYFLKGAGYHLKEGMHIGYEYDDEYSREDDIDYVSMSNDINLSEVTFGAGDFSTVDSSTIDSLHDAWDNITVNSAIDGVDMSDTITINLSDYTPKKSEK